MSASNSIVADLLRRYASAIALEGADRFKIKAYRRAADSIEALEQDIGQFIAAGGDPEDLPGIGKAISLKIREILESGKLPQLERSMARMSPELVELAAHPALDSRQVLRVYKKLGISSVPELRKRLTSGEILEKLGARIDFHIRQGLADRPRKLLWEVEKLAASVLRYLKRLPDVVDASPVGSLRRKQETVGDLNFVVATSRAAAVLGAFENYGGAIIQAGKGKAKANYRLSSGLVVELVCVKPEMFGLALLERTGSQAHWSQLRAFANRKKLSLTGRGLTAKGIDASTERPLYKALGLRYIEPELREGRDEVQAAAAKGLPQLITLQDLRGDLHMHTTESDGANSLLEMAQAAEERGYEYIAIADHSQSLKITNGLTEKRLLQQMKAIDKLNAKLKKLRILKAAEVDILEDGSLDYSDAVLKQLDLTVCSIHSKFSLNREKQTERILRAMDNRYFNILGHATGRLLLKREGYQIDIERLIKHAADAGCYFEINSSPDRLDLSAEHARLAKEAGIKIAVNTDAHSTRELGFITAGLNQARRAWLEADDVLNAMPLSKLLKQLRR